MIYKAPSLPSLFVMHLKFFDDAHTLHLWTQVERRLLLLPVLAWIVRGAAAGVLVDAKQQVCCTNTPCAEILLQFTL